jgi:hypothetical protein
MKVITLSSRIAVALAFLAAMVNGAALATEIFVSSYQVGGYYGPYMPDEAAPPSYPPTILPDNSPTFQNYFMGRTTTPMDFATPERRAFFIYDMAGIAASIPIGETIVGVSIDLTLIDGGTSALANFSDGKEVVEFTATPVPADIILDPGAIPPPSIWATFGTGIPYGSFVIAGIPDGPKTTPDGTYTIGLPGAVSAIGPAIATSSLFVVSARLATFDPGPIGASAPPPADPYEYVFGLTDVVTPSGSHAPIPFLTIITAPIPEPTSGMLFSALGLTLGSRFRQRTAPSNQRSDTPCSEHEPRIAKSGWRF